MKYFLTLAGIVLAIGAVEIYAQAIGVLMVVLANYREFLNE